MYLVIWVTWSWIATELKIAKHDALSHQTNIIKINLKIMFVLFTSNHTNQGPVSPTVFHRYSNSMEISFHSHLNFNRVIATFCFHGTTAALSWHVQQFVAISWPAMELLQCEISNAIELRAKKSLAKRAPGNIIWLHVHHSNKLCFHINYSPQIKQKLIHLYIELYTTKMSNQTLGCRSQVQTVTRNSPKLCPRKLHNIL